MKRVYLLFLVLWFQGAAYAQINRYMVFFDDKNGGSYSLENPEEFLSIKSIERRTKQNIPIKERDLPPNSNYISEVVNAGARVLYTSRWMNAALIEADESLLPLIEQLPPVTKTELAAPGESGFRRVGYSFSFGNSRRKEKSSHFQNEMIGANKMHELGFQGEDIMIAVFDGGFLGVDTLRYFSHLFNNNKIISTYDFVGNSNDVYRYDDHGTNVFSCMGAYQPDEYIGTAPQANYVLCVTEAVNSEYRIEEYNWLFAAEYADSVGVDIINSSLGYNTFDITSMDYSYNDLNGDKAVITRAADLAAAVGMLVVTSAGNERNNSWKYIVPPADADSILSVGAVNASLFPTSFSSAGPTYDNRIKPELTAIGAGTSIISSSGNIYPGNGTSYASPLIAGLAAGVWQAKPDLTNMELLQLLKSSASQFLDPDTLLGYGVPDFNKIKNIVLASEPLMAQKSLYQIFPNPIKDNSFYLKPNQQAALYNPTITMHSIKGDFIDRLDLQKDPDEELYQIELPEMIPEGTYILAILDGDIKETVRIIKQ